MPTIEPDPQEQVPKPRHFPRTERAIARMVDAIDRWPLWALSVSGLGISLCVYGAYAVPNHAWLGDFAADPFNPPTMLGGRAITSGSAYVFSSPLGVLLSYAVGGRDAKGFLAVSGLIVVGVIVAVPYLVRWWHDEVSARLTAVAVSSLPLMNVLLRTIGQPDPFTILAGTAVMVGPLWAVFLGGVLLGFNHFEQGIFIALVAITLRRIQNGPRAVPWCGIAGLLVGKALLQLHNHINGIEQARLDRADFLRHYVEGGQWKITVFGNMSTALFSIYGVGWIAVAYAWMRLPRRDARILLALQLGVFVVVLTTVDVTRVATTLTWPIVLFIVYWLAQHVPRRDLMRWSAYLFIASLVVPKVVVLGGAVSVASFWEMLTSVYGVQTG